jgi:hypothetical protein
MFDTHAHSDGWLGKFADVDRARSTAKSAADRLFVSVGGSFPRVYFESTATLND